MKRRIWGAWAFLVSLVIAAACSVDARSPELLAEPPAPTASAEAADKAAVRAAYVASVQKDASPDYRIAQTASGRRADNKAQGLVAVFAGTGVQLAPAAAEGGEALGIAATQWGCEGALLPVSAAEPEVHGNRVDYRRDGFDEWYVNGPLGLEQGFTLAAPPACQREGGRGVVIALGGDGELRAEVSAQGDAAVLRDRAGKEVLRYADLFVVDATGRKLPAVLEGGGRELSIRVDDRGAAYPIEVDPLWTQQQEISANDGTVGDTFGTSVAVSGDTAIVGAPHNASDQGAAYVFVRSGITWTEQQKLTATGGAVGDSFGSAVAVSGDTAVVGAYAKASNRGAAYVFVRSGSTWTQQQELPVSDGVTGDFFGVSVAVNGNTAVVGAYAKASNRGAAYVFVRPATSMWAQQQKLIASDGAAGDLFGVSVAVSGDTAVVGAYANASNGGAAYVFVRSGSMWTQQQKLIASDGATVDRFGMSVALSGDTAIVGAPGRASNQGAAYGFVRSATTWTQQQKFIANDGAAGDRFGVSVAVSGDTAIVGADGKTAQQGAAYVLVRFGALWTEQQPLTASNGAAGDSFGSSVAVSGDTVVVGAFGKTAQQGAAYVFVQSDNPCSNVICPSPGPCQQPGKCNPSNGTCSYPPDNEKEGKPCDDGNACTKGNTCQMGTCGQSIEKFCKALDSCHEDGTCNPTTGACTYLARPCDPTSTGAGPAPPEAGPPPVVSGKLKDCQTDDDCKDQAGHGHCSVEHVCCDTPCDDLCKSCRLKGAEGTCTPETNIDLKEDCGPKGYCLKTCIQGQCDAATSETQCAPQECTAPSSVAETAFCPEAEAECPIAQRVPLGCDPYACDHIQGACLQECASVDDCAPSFVCDPSHRCVAPPGVAVGADRACGFAPASAGAQGALAALALAALLGARRRVTRSRSVQRRLDRRPAV